MRTKFFLAGWHLQVRIVFFDGAQETAVLRFAGDDHGAAKAAFFPVLRRIEPELSFLFLGAVALQTVSDKQWANVGFEEIGIRLRLGSWNAHGAGQPECQRESELEV